MSKPLTLYNAVRDKLKVLEEFYVFDPEEEDKYEARLYAAVRAEPEVDYNIILDRVARSLISEKLNSCM